MLFLSEEYLFRDTSLDVCAAFASISREPLDRTICIFVMDAVTEGVNSSTMISSSTASSPLFTSATKAFSILLIRAMKSLYVLSPFTDELKGLR